MVMDSQASNYSPGYMEQAPSRSHEASPQSGLGFGLQAFLQQQKAARAECTCAGVYGWAQAVPRSMPCVLRIPEHLKYLKTQAINIRSQYEQCPRRAVHTEQAGGGFVDSPRGPCDVHRAATAFLLSSLHIHKYLRLQRLLHGARPEGPLEPRPLRFSEGRVADCSDNQAKV